MICTACCGDKLGFALSTWQQIPAHRGDEIEVPSAVSGTPPKPVCVTPTPGAPNMTAGPKSVKDAGVKSWLRADTTTYPGNLIPLGIKLPSFPALLKRTPPAPTNV